MVSASDIPYVIHYIIQNFNPKSAFPKSKSRIAFLKITGPYKYTKIVALCTRVHDAQLIAFVAHTKFVSFFQLKIQIFTPHGRKGEID